MSNSRLLFCTPHKQIESPKNFLSNEMQQEEVVVTREKTTCHYIRGLNELTPAFGTVIFLSESS
jgi:hypothetical protein